jgi:hypothetical protein
MGRNEDSLLRAAGENTLASATRGGSCAHPDQSRGLARRLNLRAISGVGASSPLLLFFLGGGVALHERLVGNETPRAQRECHYLRDRLQRHARSGWKRKTWFKRK